MVEERLAEVNKKLCYTLGVILLACGLLLVWLIQKGSGDFFDFDGSPPMLYWITFLALGGGILSIWRGTVFAQKEAELKALPVRCVQATVLRVERQADGKLFALFQTEQDERLRLWQPDRCRYIQGDRGRLIYKGDQVVRFEY